MTLLLLVPVKHGAALRGDELAFVPILRRSVAGGHLEAVPAISSKRRTTRRPAILVDGLERVLELDRQLNPWPPVVPPSTLVLLALAVDGRPPLRRATSVVSSGPGDRDDRALARGVDEADGVGEGACVGEGEERSGEHHRVGEEVVAGETRPPRSVTASSIPARTVFSNQSKAFTGFSAT